MKRKIRQRLLTTINSLRGAHFLIAAAMIANVLNFLFSTFLGRQIGFVEFGLVSVIGSFLSIAQIPLSSYSRAIVYKTAYLFGKDNTPASWYWRKLRNKSIKPSLILTGLWLIATPFMVWYFHSDQILPFILFTPIWSIGVAAAVDSGFLSGSHAFTAVAIMTVVESFVKLAATVIIVEMGYTSYVYIAYPLSALVSFAIGWWFASRIHNRTKVKHEEPTADIPMKFFVSTILTKLSSIAILSFDVILAKHYLSANDAGEYALLSLVGNMIYFLGSLMSQFVVPFVSRDVGAGKKSDKAFEIILLFTVVTDLAGVIGIGLFGYLTVPILFGAKAQAIIPYLPLYTIAMAAFSIGSTVVSYYQAKDNHRYSAISIMTAVGVILGISFFHSSIGQINLVMCVNAIIFLCSVIFFYQYDDKILPVFLNIEDFIRLFTDSYKRPLSTERLSILIFNWRDTRHIWGGGAENYLHELAKQWVSQGHQVTVFCGNDQRCVRNEVIDGVQIVRRGGFYTVYFWAVAYYLLRFRRNFDLVIDSENGIPFFTPLYVNVPVFLIIHHVHQEVLRKHLMFPLSYIGMFMESRLMPSVYKKTPVITVSDSSKKDIIDLGFTDSERVSVVYPGIDQKKFERTSKTNHPSLLYLGRLKDYKHIDTAIHAFQQILSKHPGAQFTIAGEGPTEDSLKKLVKKLGIESYVQFVGRVDDDQKRQLLASHWVMVQPSLFEGWGMTVIEANASGTLVVASDVNGLRESVKHQKTGLLFKPKSVHDLAEKLDLVFTDQFYRTKLSKSAYTWSQNFHWEECANSFLSIILNQLTLEKTKATNVHPVYSKSL